MTEWTRGPIPLQSSAKTTRKVNNKTSDLGQLQDALHSLPSLPCSTWDKIIAVESSLVVFTRVEPSYLCDLGEEAVLLVTLCPWLCWVAPAVRVLVRLPCAGGGGTSCTANKTTVHEDCCPRQSLETVFCWRVAMMGKSTNPLLLSYLWMLRKRSRAARSYYCTECTYK